MSLTVIDKLRQISMAAQEETEQVLTLRKAHQSVVTTMVKCIQEHLESAIMYDPGVTETFILNPQEGADFHGHHQRFVMHGSTRRKSHHLAGILLTPFEAAEQRVRNHYGDGRVSVIDVTDYDKSSNIVICVKIPLPNRGSPLYHHGSC